MTALVLAFGVGTFFAPSGYAHKSVSKNASIAAAMVARGDSEWFARADGRGRFILDQSSNPNLLLDENAGRPIEVYRSSASGGGEVWYTSSRSIVLRLSRTGGWTYFPSDQPDGVIVEPIGPAPSLTVSRVSMTELRNATEDFATSVSELARTDVVVEYSRQSAQDPAFLIETLDIIEDGVRSAPRSARQIRLIRIRTAASPSVRYSGEVLDISIAPSRGPSGQIRANEIERLLERAS